MDHFVDGGVPDVSLLFYLTSSPSGTARTTFPQRGISVQPSPGGLLAWLNVDARGQPRADAQHAVGADRRRERGRAVVLL